MFYSKISSLAGMAGKPLQNRPILVAKWLEFHVKITILAGFWLQVMCGNPVVVDDLEVIWASLGFSQSSSKLKC